MKRTRPTILVTGDVTVDWGLIVGGAPKSSIDFDWAWSGDHEVGAVSFAGGAVRAAELMEAAAARRPGVQPRIIRPVLPDAVLTSPLDERVTRTFSTIARFPASAADRTPVWRTERFMGRRPAGSVADFLPDVTEERVDVVAIHDLGIGYRGEATLWPRWEVARPRSVVFSTSPPFESNPLLARLMDGHADTLNVIVGVVDLRKSGAAIGYPQSWERTAEEVDAFIRSHALGRAMRVVVQLEMSGALIVDRDGDTTLVFDPSVPEGAWTAQRPGFMPAFPKCYMAALALPMAAGEAFDVVGAVRRAVHATRVSLREGLQATQDGSRALLLYPVGAVGQALVEDPTEIQAALHPRREGPTSIIAGVIGEDAMVDAAMRLVVSGPQSLPPGVPIERVGHWSSVDRREIEMLRSVGHVIDEYVNQYRTGGRLQRPLSVAVFGPPGAGKSFAVTQTIAQKVPGLVKTLEFNLSQFDTARELAPAFYQIRDAALEQRLPLVFWDEFDTPLEGRELGWLRHFLAPMQDGVFREAGLPRPLGPAIFVFAGGTASSFKEFVGVGDEPAERAAKKPDFVSRLRGYVDILGPNKASADDTAVVLRRALLLRSLLLRKDPLLLDRSDGHETLRIDPDVLRAFLFVGHYRHGARSMEAILDMSQLAGVLYFAQSSLPPAHLLQIHVDADEFLGLLRGEHT